jgi:hypothetical protein
MGRAMRLHAPKRSRPGAHSSVPVALVVAGALAGCAAGATATNETTSPVGQPGAASPARPHGARRDGLRVSTVSNAAVQPQPAPDSCHQIGSGPYSRPDPACTPGAVNPAVTPATIGRTICVTGWAATVRPPEAVTEQEKAASLAAYGDTGPLGAYEYDHLVPLELGGATNDPRNLWPEPGASPNPKDAVEDELRREVCDGQMSLRAAQHAIAGNWVSLARRTSVEPGG